MSQTLFMVGDDCSDILSGVGAKISKKIDAETVEIITSKEIDIADKSFGDLFAFVS